MPGSGHQQLIADSETQAGFRRAVAAVVKPGDVVLDAGCGTGLHSVFACQAGARRVYAVDRGRICEIARRVASGNGFADRVKVIRGEVGEIELPEPVDVIITHLWAADVIASMLAWKRRFLRAGGSTIPCRLDLFAALVESPDEHHNAFGFWTTRPQGVDYAAAAEEALRRTHTTRFETEQLVTAEERVATFDFRRDDEPWFRAELTTEAKRSGTIHGLAISLEEWLSEDVVLSTRPPTTLPRNIWQNIFLPLRAPLAVAAGDSLALAMRMRFSTDGLAGEWSIAARGEAVVRQALISAAALAAALPDQHG